jgi:hypothetical protein
VTVRLKPGAADVLVSTDAPAPDRSFLQVIAWDPVNSEFNFYERPPVDEREPRTFWVWRGGSRHAVDRRTRGQGCFECHTGGAPVIKELKQPWLHWKAMGGAAVNDALAPDSSLRIDPLFVASRGAQDLEELVIRPSIGRLYRPRSERWVAADGTVAELRTVLRPLFESTGVNLASSPQESRASGDKQLPRGFLLNDKLLLGSDELGVDPPDDFRGGFAVSSFVFGFQSRRLRGFKLCFWFSVGVPGSA